MCSKVKVVVVNALIKAQNLTLAVCLERLRLEIGDLCHR